MGGVNLAMQNPKISVIIPIYNSEKYLDYCIASVLVQTYKNLEIICVNDGSTDNSLNILKKYASNDDRIIIINQENYGQSVARNTGLKFATGEWISFIDSDDWIGIECYQKFIDVLNNRAEFDLYMFNGTVYPENNTLSFDIKDWTGENPHTFSDCKNPFKGNISANNKIYNREFLLKNNLSFSENKIFEDQLFIITAQILAKNIYLQNEVFYWYRQHEGSTVHNFGRNAFDIVDVLNLIKEKLKENNLWESAKYNFLQHKYNMYFWIMLGRLPVDLKKEFYYFVKSDLERETDYDMKVVRLLDDCHLYFRFIEKDFEEFCAEEIISD